LNKGKCAAMSSARQGLGPDEFEIGRIEFGCQNIVDQRLRPGEDRRRALHLGQLLLGLGGGSVDRLGESLGRDRESKADDAREPFVEGPLEFRLLCLDEGLRELLDGVSAFHATAHNQILPEIRTKCDSNSRGNSLKE
jgi:hypothetical protein